MVYGYLAKSAPVTRRNEHPLAAAGRAARANDARRFGTQPFTARDRELREDICGF